MTDSIWSKLAAPLDPESIKILAQPGRKPMSYVDSRTVTDRLDAIVPGEWDLTLELLPRLENPRDGEEYAIKARLTVLGVPREDIGQGSDYKSAASDALKRAAVRFGIGRELYGAKVEGNAVAAPPSARDVSREQAKGQADPRPAATIPIPVSDAPACPKCGGKTWDNRVGKKNPKAPDFKCRDKTCDGCIWPPKPNARAAVGTPATPKDETDDEFVARFAEDADSLPF